VDVCSWSKGRISGEDVGDVVVGAVHIMVLLWG
jgi:hypothetical protein